MEIIKTKLRYQNGRGDAARPFGAEQFIALNPHVCAEVLNYAVTAFRHKAMRMTSDQLLSELEAILSEQATVDWSKFQVRYAEHKGTYE